jgi:hypothetical protein
MVARGQKYSSRSSLKIRGYRERAIKREIRVNFLVHTSRGVGVDHIVDICGARNLEQSFEVLRGEGIMKAPFLSMHIFE